MDYINHTVARNDTIQRIAQQYGVDDWRVIVEINNLRYPYILPDINLNNLQSNITERGAVLTIGQTLLIPPVNIYKSVETIDKSRIEELAYGIDIDLFSNNTPKGYNGTYKSIYGEIEAENRDIKIVRGIQNLRQAILIRLSTPPGTLELHPYYGSDIISLIGEKRTGNNITKIKLEAERAILSDKRVKKVEAVKITPENHDTINIECGIYPVEPVAGFRFSENITNFKRGDVYA